MRQSFWNGQAAVVTEVLWYHWPMRRRYLVSAAFARHVARLSCMAIVVLATQMMHVNAQPVSMLADRDSLAARLTRAIATLGPSHTSELIDVSDLQIEVLGLGGCERIWSSVTNPGSYPTNLKLKYHSADEFSIEVENRPAASMDLTYNSHVLPCYLNGLMFHNWGKPFLDSLNDYKFWDDEAPHPPSTQTPLFTQTYYMGRNPLTPGMHDSVLPALQENAYDEVLLEDYNTTTLGKDIFNTLRPDMPFIARFKPADVGSVDTNIAKPTEWELVFRKDEGLGDGTWDPDLDSTVARIKFIARTQEYSPTDCSFGTFVPAHNQDSAWYAVLVTIVKKNGLGEFEESPYVRRCHHAFKDSIGGAEVNNAALWSNYDFLAGGPLSWWCRFNLNADGWLVFEMFGGSCSTRDTLKIRRIKNPDIPAQVCESRFETGGEFCVDRMTGEIYYWTGSICGLGERQAVTCLQFCHPVRGTRKMDGVLAASAQPFSDDWKYDRNEYGNPANHSSPYQSGDRGKWRPDAHYAYRTSILSADTDFGSNSRIYTSAGVFIDSSGSTSNAFTLYDFTNERANDPRKWSKGDSITQFSPSGEPVEEQDVLGIYSAARYGHGQMLPKLVARNAEYEAVDFESFEDGAGNTMTSAHSGRYSYLFESGSSIKLVGPFTVTNQVKTEGLQIQFWARKTYWDVGSHSSPPVAVTLNGLTTSATLDSVAKTGAWTLYRMNVDDISGTAVLNSTFDISFDKEIGSTDSLWIDDIRVQPLDAQMVCYVYDPFWLRLVATFDDQHFGQFYQYNGEGKLIRTMKETERGMKTVAETHYHTPLIDRTTPLSSLMVDYGGMNANGLGGRFGRDNSDKENGNGINGSTDVLDVELSPDGVNTKIFGRDPSQLPTLDELQNAGNLLPKLDLSWLGDTNALKTDRIEKVAIPGVVEVEKIRVLREVKELDAQLEQLAQRREKATSVVEKEKIEEEARRLYEKRATLIREKLGLTEEKLRELESQGIEVRSEE